jgi:spore coat polysaccharide biosynthesis protein SpsF
MTGRPMELSAATTVDARVCGVIQARNTSTRLPGKVLKPILGRPMLSLLIERLRRSTRLDGLIVAMTDRPEDDSIEALCEAESMAFFRGDENDVLGRFHRALEACAPGTDVVVRITSDCPLLDPDIVDDQCGYFLENRERFDYVSVGRTPRLPNGASVEAFSRTALERAFKEAREAYDREHVTPYIQRPETGFQTGVTPTAINAPDFRLSVDTAADLAMVEKVFEALYPTNPAFSLKDVITFLEANPQVRAINAGVDQATGPYAKS